MPVILQWIAKWLGIPLAKWLLTNLGAWAVTQIKLYKNKAKVKKEVKEIMDEPDAQTRAKRMNERFKWNKR